jgi:hypothetical protein
MIFGINAGEFVIAVLAGLVVIAVFAPMILHTIAAAQLKEIFSQLIYSQGMTPQQARSHIRSIKMKPWCLRYLLSSKYGPRYDYYTADFLKDFTYKHFGPSPKRI